MPFAGSIVRGFYYHLLMRETNDEDAHGNQADAWTAPIWFKAP